MKNIWDKKIKTIFLILYIFLFLFFPPFISLGTHYFLAAIALGYIVFNINEFLVFLKWKNVFYSLLIILILLLYIVGIAYINNRQMKAVVYGPAFWIGVYIPICFFILNILKKEKASFYDLVMMIVICCNLQGILAVISFVFAPFHTWVLNRFIAYGYDAARYTSLSNYRLYGFAFHLTNFAPLIAVVMTVIMIKYSFVNKKYLLATPLMIIFIVLNSRTALILLILGIMFILFIQAKKLSVNTIRKIMIGSGIVLLVFIVGNKLLKTMHNSENAWYAGWVMSGFEQIFGLFKGEKNGYFEYVASDSTWSLPEGLKLIFGSGVEAIYPHDGHKGTDVGFINYLWLGGLFYLFGIFALVIVMAKPFYQKGAKWLFMFLGIVFVVINVKDVLFTQNEFMCLLFLLSFGMGYLKKDFLNTLFRICDKRTLLY
ncbi:hypothetical protein [Ruminococcus sp.]|uniref:hypothetical protein n=1 Tax=Ruminococcus sp. TaxID=41978 RepID=UPI0025FB0457|nr:hypothetical protein [Ruminococcus sp.]